MHTAAMESMFVAHALCQISNFETSEHFSWIFSWLVTSVLRVSIADSGWYSQPLKPMEARTKKVLELLICNYFLT